MHKWFMSSAGVSLYSFFLRQYFIILICSCFALSDCWLWLSPDIWRSFTSLCLAFFLFPPLWESHKLRFVYFHHAPFSSLLFSITFFLTFPYEGRELFLVDKNRKFASSARQLPPQTDWDREEWGFWDGRYTKRDGGTGARSMLMKHRRGDVGHPSLPPIRVISPWAGRGRGNQSKHTHTYVPIWARVSRNWL